MTVLFILAGVFFLSVCAFLKISAKQPMAVSNKGTVSAAELPSRMETFHTDEPSSQTETQTTASATRTRETPPSKAAIKNGEFSAAFEDILISGDSLVKSICEFGIMDETRVMAEVGAGTKYLSDTTDDIVAAHPKYLILHYGENELDKKENAVYFIRRYKRRILALQSKLPHTEIYVDSIFPVKEKAYVTEPYTVNIAYYNSLLEEMAGELHVTYLDYAGLWRSFDKDYYDADGIHMKRSFYTKEYLPYVYAMAKGQ